MENNFCRYCGKQLINGQCGCVGYQNAYAEYLKQEGPEAQNQNHFIVDSMTPDCSSVSNFVNSIKYNSGMSDVNTKNGGAYERNIPIVPNCVNQEDNEIIVKQYNIAKLRTRLKFMRAEGRLMVTNRRILFRAAGTSLTGNLLQEHQFNLDEIGGIEMHKDYKFSFLNLLGCLLIQAFMIGFYELLMMFTGDAVTALSVACGILGWVPTFFVYRKQWLKYLGSCFSVMAWATVMAMNPDARILILVAVIAVIIMLVNLFFTCFVPNLVINIKTKGANGAVVIGSKKSIFQRQVGDDYSGFMEVLPWEDTVMAMNELGTMIDDLQKQGDYAIAKWAK